MAECEPVSNSGINPVSNQKRMIVFSGFAIILMIMGLVLSPSIQALLEGMVKIIFHPSLLDFDALQQAGHFGSAFFNSGLLLTIVLIVYVITGTKIQGSQIAAAMMMVGFAFYGKNPLNIWFPVTGVFLHAVIRKKELKSVTALAWFSTALAPVFSVLAFGTPALKEGSAIAYLCGGVFGILSGIMVCVFVSHLHELHKDRVLYNAGFAAGLSGMLINALQKALGIGHDKYPYVELADAAATGARADYVSGSNVELGLILLVLFAYLIFAGLLLKGGKGFKKLVMHKCKGGDFAEEFGFGQTLVNMGFMGVIMIAFVFVTIKGQLAGPVFGSIWTVVGFAAAGVTLRMHLPILAGVYVTSFITGGIAGALGGASFLETALTKAGSRGMLLAAMFSAGLSPIVNEFGIASGLFVGGVHSILVSNTGSLHGWMSLYNNGMCLGFIATFFPPLYSKFKMGKIKSIKAERKY